MKEARPLRRPVSGRLRQFLLLPVVLMTLPTSSRLFAFTVETKFPGGNAVVEEITEDTIRIAPDIRDSSLPWFYWNFAVNGAAGQTLHFVVAPQNMGARGPAVSKDGGQTWKWLGLDAVKDGKFSYPFGPQDHEVRFSVGMPYVSSHLDRFLAKHQGNSFLQKKTLTTSKGGQPVPLLELSDPQRKAPYAVAVLARSHACEMMGSYVMEGILEGILANDARGTWLRKHADFFLVPFVDRDGVENGDQGKNRAPHDHNRDYGDETIYPEVAAIKEQLPAWTAGRPLVFFDLHDPALKNDVHETLCFLESPNPDHTAPLERFMKLLDRNQQGSILVEPTMIMKRGTGFNTFPPGGVPRHGTGWASTLPNTLLASTLELPYANAGGFVVNAESARSLGRDIIRAVADFLQESPKP